MNKKSLIAIAVVSAMANGYRRAGIALAQGTNNLDVNQEQLDLLKSDSNLTVIVKAEQKVNVGEIDEKVEMDFSWVPEPLAPWIAVIHEMHTETPLAKRPTVDQLEVEVPAEGLAEAFKYKPTAAQADEAWQHYLDNVINHVPDNNADSAKG